MLSLRLAQPSGHRLIASEVSTLAITGLDLNTRAQRIAAEAIRIIARDQPSSLAHTAIDAALVTPREPWRPRCLGDWACSGVDVPLSLYMVETFVNLTDHAFPRLPVRQGVLSVSMRLRDFTPRSSA